MLGFKASTRRYKNLDFSSLSDAELNYLDNLMGKAIYPNATEPDGGQLYEGDGDRFDKHYKIARATSLGLGKARPAGGTSRRGNDLIEYGGVEIPADLQVVGWAHTRCRREWIDLYYPAGQAPDARAMYQDAKIVASQAEGEGLSKETRVAAYLFVITFENLWEGLYERLRGQADQDR